MPRLQLNMLKNNLEIQERYRIKGNNRFEMLDRMVDVEQQYKDLQRILAETAEEVLPKRVRRAKQKWMTEEILEMMEERRKWKNKDNMKYRERDKKIRAECAKAKECWIDSICSEIEYLERTDIEKMHQEVKKISGKRVIEVVICV